MRKKYLYWMIAVFGIVGVVYGTQALVYSFSHDKGLSVPGLVFLILGSLALVFLLVLILIDRYQNKKNVSVPVAEEKGEEAVPVEETKQEPIPSPKVEQDRVVEAKQEKGEPIYEPPKPQKRNASYYDRSYSTVYVKKVGHGPMLRIEGPRIVDMRSNTYYRIEGDFVMQDGYGTRFEIRGNQIKDAFGSYLYELSGSNINKVFGGFYASISGNCITLYDLSEKYEMTDSLSKKQILVAVALLFDRY